MVTHAVVAWTTEYYGLVVAAMRAEDRSIDDVPTATSVMPLLEAVDDPRRRVPRIASLSC